jgi:hypothetical protein
MTGLARYLAAAAIAGLAGGLALPIAFGRAFLAAIGAS